MGIRSSHLIASSRSSKNASSSFLIWAVVSVDRPSSRERPSIATRQPFKAGDTALFAMKSTRPLSSLASSCAFLKFTRMFRTLDWKQDQSQACFEHPVSRFDSLPGQA